MSRQTKFRCTNCNSINYVYENEEEDSRANSSLTIMPFGKYKGKTFKSIVALPNGINYLNWFVQLPQLYPNTKQAIQEILDDVHRQQEQTRCITPPSSPTEQKQQSKSS